MLDKRCYTDNGTTLGGGGWVVVAKPGAFGSYRTSLHTASDYSQHVQLSYCPPNTHLQRVNSPSTKHVHGTFEIKNHDLSRSSMHITGMIT